MPLSSLETVTVLITDLVGSTGLASRARPGGRRRAAARALRRSCARPWRPPAAQEVKNTGDGLMVVFRGAAAAVACAVAIQQRIERRNRRARASRWRSAIGVALGDATLRGRRLLRHAGGRGGAPVRPGGRRADPDHRARPADRRARRPRVQPGGRARAARAARAGARLRGGLGAGRRSASDEAPAPAAAAGRARRRLRRARADERERVAGALGGRARRPARRRCSSPASPGSARPASPPTPRCELHGRGRGGAVRPLRRGGRRRPTRPWIQALSPPRRARAGRRAGRARRAPRRRAGAARPGARAARARGARAPRADGSRDRALPALLGGRRACSSRRAPTSPVVLLLDDLHWADRPTLALLRHVVAETARPAAARPRHLPRHATSRATIRSPTCSPTCAARRASSGWRCAGSASDDVVSLMEAGRRATSWTPIGLALAREITAETDGNPFFVGEMLRHLSESGALVQGADGRWELRARARRARPAPERARGGRPAGRAARRGLPRRAELRRGDRPRVRPRPARARSCARTRTSSIDLLDAAVEASLLQERSERTGAFSLRAQPDQPHALRRAAARPAGRACTGASPRRSRTSAARTRTRAWRSSRATGRRPPRRWSPARRWPTAGGRASRRWPSWRPTRRCAGSPRRSSCSTSAPGRRSGRALRPDDRAGRGAAAGRAAGVPRDAAAARRGSRTSWATPTGWRAPRWPTTAASPARSAPSTRSGWRRSSARSSGTAIDPARCARLLALQAMELQFDPDHERRRALADEALALARRGGRRRASSPTSCATTSTPCGRPTRWLPARRTAEEMTELAERLDDPLARHLGAGPHDPRRRRVRRPCARPARRRRSSWRAPSELGQPRLRWHATYYAAGLAQLRGRAGGGRAPGRAPRSAGRARRASPTRVVIHLGRSACCAPSRAGRAEIVEMLERAVAQNPGIPASRPALRRPVRRRARGRGRGAGWSAPRTAGSPASPATRSTRPRWRCGPGRPPTSGSQRAAAPLYDLIEPWRELVVWNGSTGYGSAEAYLGMLAATLGAHDRAEEHFAAASRLHRRRASTAGRRRICAGGPRACWTPATRPEHGPRPTRRWRWPSVWGRRSPRARPRASYGWDPSDERAIPAAGEFADIERHVERLDSYTGLYHATRVVFYPKDRDEVSCIFSWAAERKRRVTLRAGGHSFDAQALGNDLVVSLTRLNERSTSLAARTSACGSARARPGGHPRARSSHKGLVPAVTVTTAHATAGGTLSGDCLSRFSPAYGKEGEWVESFDLVTPDGELHTCRPRRDDPDSLGGAAVPRRHRRARVPRRRGLDHLRACSTCARPRGRSAWTPASEARLLPEPRRRARARRCSRPRDSAGPLRQGQARLRVGGGLRGPGRPPGRARVHVLLHLAARPPAHGLHHPGLAFRVLVEWAMTVPPVPTIAWRLAYRFLYSDDRRYIDDLEGFTFFMDGNRRAKRLAKKHSAGRRRRCSRRSSCPSDRGDAGDDLVRWLMYAHDYLSGCGLTPTLQDVLWLPKESCPSACPPPRTARGSR